MKISKAKIQYVAQLKHKKFRREYGVFTAEGTKCVIDTIGAFNIKMFVATDAWLNSDSFSEISDLVRNTELYSASPAEMQRMSQLSTSPQVLAVYNIPEVDSSQWGDNIDNRLTLLLDGVQDPGNLGTIIRTADWFGIHHIAASKETADLYNIKTVQATMGAISRVKMIYTDLVEIVSEYPNIPVYGTLLEGGNIYDAHLENVGFIVMGNEGSGISPQMRERISSGLFIPSYPPNVSGSESLNVAAATAITLAEFRRRNH